MLINIDRGRMLKGIIIALVAIEVALVILDAVVSEYRLTDIGAGRRLFNITREDGVPNFFSSFLLLGVGGILLLVTMVVRGLGSNSKVVWGWGGHWAVFVPRLRRWHQATRAYRIDIRRPGHRCLR